MTAEDTVQMGGVRFLEVSFILFHRLLCMQAVVFSDSILKSLFSTRSSEFYIGTVLIVDNTIIIMIYYNYRGDNDMAKSKTGKRSSKTGNSTKATNANNSVPKETAKTKDQNAEELKGIEALKKSISENKAYWLYFTVIGIVFLFTRLVQITILPKGLHIDEISMGYNTWTLSQFGTDRYGVSFPVYFNNAGSGQSSLYVYIAFLLSKIFGYSVFTLRVVSVFFGLLLLIFGTKTAYEMFGAKCAVITAAVIDIMPFFIMSERWAFDCNAMLPMFVMFLYFFVRLIKTGKNKYALISGIMFGISMYSYILAVMMMPVFLVLALIYALIKKEITIKQTGIMFFSAIVVSVPILLYLLVVVGILPEFKIGCITFTNASAGRLSEIGWQSLSIKEIIKNINTLTSCDQYDFMADDKYGVFYQNVLHFSHYKISVSQILLFLGFVFMLFSTVYNIVKKKEFSFELIVLFYMLAVMYPMTLLEQLAIYRYNAVYFAFALLLAYMFSKLWEHRSYLICFFAALLYLANFCGYTYYLFSGSFTEQNKALAYFDYDLLELCETFRNEEYADSQIYVDYTATYNAGLITLYGLRVEPSVIQSEVESIDSKVMTYGNIHIGIPETVDQAEKAVYVIRDINSESSYYTTNVQQMELYKTLVNNNKTKEKLLELNTPYDIKNNYYVFKLNE